jgi:hypothetical protein
MENNISFIQNSDFLSNKLTNVELNFLLNEWITKIVIVRGDKIREAILSPEQSEEFRDVFNCLYKIDQK